MEENQVEIEIKKKKWWIYIFDQAAESLSLY
jgi:hypothetical protein